MVEGRLGLRIGPELKARMESWVVVEAKTGVLPGKAEGLTFRVPKDLTLSCPDERFVRRRRGAVHTPKR